MTLTTQPDRHIKTYGETRYLQATSYVVQTTLTVDGANSGVLLLTGLPTSDPHVLGQVYNNAGTLKVSAG